MKLIDFMLRRPLAVYLTIISILGIGGVLYLQMPIAALPDIEYPTILVQSELPGASPETVSSTVTTPLEQNLLSVPDIRAITSSSTQERSTITLSFKSGTSVDIASMAVEGAIQRALPDLPNDMPNIPQWVVDNPADSAVIVLALTSDSVPLPKVDELADSNFIKNAAKIPGVRRTSDYARARWAIRIEVNPDALTTRNLTLEDVRAAVTAATDHRAKGKLDGGATIATIDANDQLLTVEDFQGIVVSWIKNAPIYLRDVAQVSINADDDQLGGTFNGMPAVAFGYKRSRGANVVSTAAEIRSAVQYKSAALPDSVEIHPAIDRSRSIVSAIHDIQKTLLVTVLSVVGIIFLFLRDVRSCLIASISIPVSLAGTAIGMYLLDLTLDNLTLIALTIAVGFVVDDAILVSENIFRNLEGGDGLIESIKRGLDEIYFTVISITTSLVIVFLPVFFVSGPLGLLLRAFGLTLCLAILISGIVSVIVIPVLFAGFRRTPLSERIRRGAHFKSSTEHVVTRLYRRSIGFVLASPTISIALVAGTFVGAGYLYVQIPKGFLPPQDSGRIVCALDLEADMSRGAVALATRQAATLIQQDPDVENTLEYDQGEILIQLRDSEQRNSSTRDVARRLHQRIRKIDASPVYFFPAPEISLGSWVTKAEFQYTLSDASLEELNAWAPKLLEAISRSPAIADVALNDPDRRTELQISIDREMAARYGISINAIDDTLYDAFGPRRLKHVFTSAGLHDILFSIDARHRVDDESLRALYIRSSAGELISLRNLITIEKNKQPVVLRHSNLLPAVGMSFNVKTGHSLGEAVSDIRKAEREIVKPSSLLSSFDGAAGEFESSLSREPYIICAALAAVYAVLAILYQSLSHPITIISTLPSAGLGGLAALKIFGFDLDVIGVIGLLLLIGIVKKNAIMIVDFSISAEKRGHSQIDAVKEACVLRLRPMLMTTSAAVIGAVPLALGTSLGSEMRRPLGVLIIGGLISSQIFSLYITPIIHLNLQRAFRKLIVRSTVLNHAS